MSRGSMQKRLVNAFGPRCEQQAEGKVKNHDFSVIRSSWGDLIDPILHRFAAFYVRCDVLENFNR